jgi:hypothetical protein
MADIDLGNGYGAGGSANLVWTDSSTGYAFISNGSLTPGFAYKKTTDGGATWGSLQSISSGAGDGSFGIWYDKWTDGTGTKIHLFYHDDSNFVYNYLDTSDDSVGTAVSVYSGQSSGNFDDLSVVRARGGNIYVVSTRNNDLYRSTDSGSTWSARATVGVGSDDQLKLAPGAEVDGNDIFVIFADNGDDDVILKVYDDSANTVSTANIDTGLLINTGTSILRVSHRKSDNHCILAYWYLYNNANADIKAFDIGGTSSITQLTNPVENKDDAASKCGVLVDNNTDDIYCVYGYGSSGVYYKKSTDGGTTWGAEETLTNESLNSTSDDITDMGTAVDTLPSTLRAYYGSSSNAKITSPSITSPSSVKDIISSGIIPFNR